VNDFMLTIQIASIIIGSVAVIVNTVLLGSALISCQGGGLSRREKFESAIIILALVVNIASGLAAAYLAFIFMGW